MSKWSIKKKSIFQLTLFALILIFGSVGYFFYSYEKPSCFDGVQNGLEVGIDCSGGCEKVCNFGLSKLSIAWARSFKISNPEEDNVYASVAYIKNPNFNKSIDKINYEFSFYDKENKLVITKRNETSIVSGSETAVFVPFVEAGKKEIVRTIFRFLEAENYINKSIVYNIAIKEFELIDYETKPRIKITIINKDNKIASNVDIVLIVYDKNNNAVAVSKSFINKINSNEERELFFTWVYPWILNKEKCELKEGLCEVEPAKIEILTKSKN